MDLSPSNQPKKRKLLASKICYSTFSCGLTIIAKDVSVSRLDADVFLASSVDETEADCFGGVSPPSPKIGAEREQISEKDTGCEKMEQLSRKLMFLLLIPMVLTLTLVGIMQVKATDPYFLAWGGLDDDPAPPSGEWYTEHWVCYDIAYNIIGQTGYFGLSETNWDNFTDQYWVDFCLDYVQENQIPTFHLWVGDFNFNYTDGNYHYGFFPSYPALVLGPGDNGEYVWDHKVYDKTGGSQSYQVNMFDWTCACAGLYFNTSDGDPPLEPHLLWNYDDIGDSYGWLWTGDTDKVGMPLGWTHRLDLSTDGYSSPNQSQVYCYIGWQNWAPYLNQHPPGSLSYNVNMVYYTYAFAMGQIDEEYHLFKDALDYATWTVYGIDFGSSYYNYGWRNCYDLWSRMQVLGNSLVW
jgi:hypothetical protein